jgi:hypothetical protein
VSRSAEIFSTGEAGPRRWVTPRYNSIGSTPTRSIHPPGRNVSKSTLDQDRSTRYVGTPASHFQCECPAPWEYRNPESVTLRFVSRAGRGWRMGVLTGGGMCYTRYRGEGWPRGRSGEMPNLLRSLLFFCHVRDDSGASRHKPFGNRQDRAPIRRLARHAGGPSGDRVEEPRLPANANGPGHEHRMG